MTDLAVSIRAPKLRLVSSDEGPAQPEADAGPRQVYHEGLAGKSVLIVEDETFVALELKFAVEDAGGAALGPFYRLAQAMEFLSRREAAIDAAILDVILGGSSVFPLAKRLADRGVPLLFSTANADLPELANEFPAASVCAKPASPAMVLTALSRLLA